MIGCTLIIVALPSAAASLRTALDAALISKIVREIHKDFTSCHHSSRSRNGERRHRGSPQGRRFAAAPPGLAAGPSPAHPCRAGVGRARRRCGSRRHAGPLRTRVAGTLYAVALAEHPAARLSGLAYPYHQRTGQAWHADREGLAKMDAVP